MKTQVKICGITRKEDAQLAMELGATALGFIFADSPRRVSSVQVQDILKEVPQQILSVGVFVDEKPETILSVCKELDLRAVQLHGRELPSEVSFLRKLLPRTKMIKSIGINEEGFEQDPLHYEECDFLLFDSSAPRKTQGPRALVSWKYLADFKSKTPYFIAGGLNSENVGVVLKTLQPFGVDVSSSIESSPGVKNHQKMQSFFSAIGDSYVG